MSRDDWLAEAASWREDGLGFVVATILGVRGSTPVVAGQRMLVGERRLHGTVGGGRLEQEIIDKSRRMLAEGSCAPSIDALTLSASLGQCCGGRVFVHFDVVAPAPGSHVVFGAGHVGQELVRILARLPGKVVCVDSRAQWLDRLPCEDNVEARLDDDPAAVAAGLPPGCRCLVLTHSHALDLEICAALLGRGDMGYIGLIGSKTKAQRFRRKLAARKLDAAGLECPVGEQAGKHPAMVAIAMAARVIGRTAQSEAGGQDKAARQLLEELAQLSVAELDA